MDRDRWLAAVSACQLGVGVLGMAVALKRRYPYDVPLLHGHPANVARDSVVMGTALSAPVVMLAAQGVTTTRLFRENGDAARLALGVLGTTMVAGYLGESLVRQRLQWSSCHPLETPLVVTGIILAGAMAVLGLQRVTP